MLRRLRAAKGPPNGRGTAPEIVVASHIAARPLCACEAVILHAIAEHWLDASHAEADIFLPCLAPPQHPPTLTPLSTTSKAGAMTCNRSASSATYSVLGHTCVAATEEFRAHVQRCGDRCCHMLARTFSCGHACRRLCHQVAKQLHLLGTRESMVAIAKGSTPPAFVFAIVASMARLELNWLWYMRMCM